MVTKKLQNDEKRIVPIAYDEVFKATFGEEYPDNTAYLASLLLDIPYEKVKGKVEFKPLRHLDARVRDVKSEKDLVFMLNINDGYKICMEVNLWPNGIQTIVERNYYYVANLFGGGLKEKENYTEIKTTLQYNFNNFAISKDSPNKLERKFKMQDEEGILSSKLEIVHINLAEAKSLWYDNDITNYDERMRKLICLGTLMLTDNKDEFYGILEKLDAPGEIKQSIRERVEWMNDDDELNVRYYNRDEEWQRMCEGAVIEWKRNWTKEANEQLQIEIEQAKKQLEIDLQKQKKEELRKDIEAQYKEETEKRIKQLEQELREKIIKEIEEKMKNKLQ